MLQQMVADQVILFLSVRSLGVFYRNKFFLICGGLFTGHLKYFHGKFISVLEDNKESSCVIADHSILSHRSRKDKDVWKFVYKVLIFTFKYHKLFFQTVILGLGEALDLCSWQVISFSILGTPWGALQIYGS